MADSLRDEIHQFRRRKSSLAIALIAIGAIGVVVPLFPGLLAVGLGIWLLFPQKSEEILRRIRRTSKIFQ